MIKYRIFEYKTCQIIVNLVESFSPFRVHGKDDFCFRDNLVGIPGKDNNTLLAVLSLLILMLEASSLVTKQAGADITGQLQVGPMLYTLYIDINVRVVKMLHTDNKQQITK